ncbi:multiple sugar transport system substrate-binding protein [Bradyrhizobium sp. i1.3.1]
MFKRSLLPLLFLMGACIQQAEAAGIDVISVGSLVPPQLIEAFKTEHPEIKLTVRPPATDYDDLTQRLLRDNVTGTAPDVIFQGYNRSELTIRRGLVVPLSPFLTEDKPWAESSYHAISDDLCRTDGKLYGLPFVISVPIIYYNVELVRQAGGDPDHLPHTWPEITALAARITALGANRIGGFFDYAAAGNWTFMALIESQGGRMMSADDRTITFNGPEGLRALEILRDFGKAGQVDMPREQAYQAFSAGTIGMIVTSSGFLKTQLKQVKFDLRTTAIPIVHKGRLPVGGNCVMMVTRKPEHQKAAWTFMKFVTSPAAQNIVSDVTSYLPGNQITIAALEASTPPADPRMAAIRAAGKAGGWYSFPGDNSLRITDRIRLLLQDVVTLRRSPEDAMKAMTEAVQQLLPK